MNDHDHLPHEVADALATGGAELVLAALRAVWNRVSPLLGDAMTASIFARPVADAARANPALGLAVTRDGFSVAAEPAGNPSELAASAAALLDELLATVETLLGTTVARGAMSDLEAVARVHRVLAQQRGMLKAMR